MTTIAPPVPPRVQLQTDRARRQYYTLHYNRNNAFTLKLDEDTRTAVVGFAEITDAVRVGNMFETYFVEKKEWPDMHGARQLVLPEGRLKELGQIFIQKWEFDELKVLCLSNFIDFISVEQLTPQGGATFRLSGSLYRLDASDDYYRERLHELFLLGM